MNLSWNCIGVTHEYWECDVDISSDKLQKDILKTKAKIETNKKDLANVNQEIENVKKNHQNHLI